MFEELKIKIFGTQPTATVTTKQLDRLIRREFAQYFDEVKTRLDKVDSDTPRGKKRISVAIIRLSKRELKSLDHYLDMAKADYRDVLLLAEYPRCARLGFDDIDKREMKSIYLDDWREYSKWLND